MLRDVLVFAVLYAVVVWLIPPRWLPAEGLRYEWKALLGAAIVTLLVMAVPALLLVVILIRVGDWVWSKASAASPTPGA